MLTEEGNIRWKRRAGVSRRPGCAQSVGRRLIDAKERCGHGGWLPWLEREFGWSDQTARRFMQVGEASKSNNLLNLSVDVSGLYLLAAPSTPPAVIDAVAERSADGARLTLKEVERLIAIRSGASLDRLWEIPIAL